MIGRRSIVSAALAGIAAGAAGVTVAASPRPDAVLAGLITDWLAARDAARVACDQHDNATIRAERRYPAELPPWMGWREANHPAGRYKILPIDEDPSPRMRALNAELERCPLDDSGRRHPPVELVSKVCIAIEDARETHYASIRPAYDRMIAERQAAIAAIDTEEGLPALAAEREAAFDRACEAFDALGAHRPATVDGVLRKAATLLRFPFVAGQFDDDSGETAAILADIEAIIGGAA